MAVSPTLLRQRFLTWRVVFTVGVTLVVLFTAGWLVSDGWRNAKAAGFDEKSRAALERNDLGLAYRNAQFAVAVKPTDARRLSAGAIAYLRKDYAAAVDYFDSLARGSAERARGQVGKAAAAGRQGDSPEYERARAELGTPRDSLLRVTLANAAIDAGDLETPRRILSDASPDTRNQAYPKVIGQAAENPADALLTLANLPGNFLKIESAPPAYQRFLREVNFISDDGLDKIRETVTAQSQTGSAPTRQLLLAQRLYFLEEYRAAHTLADRTARAEPTYRDAWNTLAATQIALGNLKGAEQSLKTSLDLDQGNGYAWYLRSELARLQDDPEKSREYREQAETLGYEKPL